MKTMVALLSLVLFTSLISNVMMTQTLIDYKASFEKHKICSNGRLQSPINLVPDQSEFKTDISFLSDDYDTLSGKMTFGDDGTVYSLKAGAGNNFGTIYLSKNGFVTKNLLKEIRVHAPSEHELNGVAGSLEVMLIHERVIDFRSDVNANRKVSDPNMSFIISILFTTQSSAQSDGGFISQLFKGWTNHKTDAAFVSTEELNYQMNDFELIRAKQFFFYEGSQTNFPCNENANYIVINQMFRIDTPLFDFINKQFGMRYLNGKANKPIAQYQGRPIFRNFLISENELSGIFFKLTVTFFGILSLLLL